MLWIDAPSIPASVMQIAVWLSIRPNVGDTMRAIGAVTDLKPTVVLAPLEADPTVAFAILNPLRVEAGSQARGLWWDWSGQGGESTALLPSLSNPASGRHSST